MGEYPSIQIYLRQENVMYIGLERLLIKTNFIRCIFLIFFLFFTATLPVSAEIQTITATGDYTIGEGETMPVGKERALVEAVKSATEQAGVYVESYSKISNFVLAKDEVNVLARGVVEVLDKHYDEPKYIGSGYYLRVTITARVDTSNIEALRHTFQSKSSVSDLKRIQTAYEDCQREIKKLKEQLAQVSGAEKKDIAQRIAQNEKRFMITRWIEQGYGLAIGQKSYEAAIQSFTQAINLDTHYAYAYFNRANAYHELKQYDLALADYDKAIALDPTDDYAYYNRGVAYENVKRYDLAMADYDKAIILNPNNLYAYNSRGIVYARTKQYNLALADYDKAIAIDPNNAYAYNNRGNAYFELNQYQQAVADYDKSIAIDPNNASAYNNRGEAERALGQYDLAIADYDKAITLGSNTAHVFNSRGMAYAKLKQYQEAIDNYDKAIELEPDNVFAYYNRSAANYNFKKYEAAITDYDKIIVLDPSRIDVYFYKGIALTYLNRPQEAIDVLHIYIQYSNDFSKNEIAKKIIRQLGGLL
jgi:tetratricopeptide (TPR) repeat protein